MPCEGAAIDIDMTTTLNSQSPSTQRSRGRRSRALGWVLLLTGALALALLAWGAVSTLAVARHATAASSHVREVQSAIEQEDYPGAEEATREAARDTSAAQDAASSLPLRLASHLPGRAGALTGAVRTVVSASDLAVSSGALPLVEVASTAEDPRSLLRADGSIDVQQVSAAAARVHPAAGALRRAQRQVDGVDLGVLPAPLRRSVLSARDGVEELAVRAAEADSVLAVLPAALGADGPRSYLVAFQNTAELRPTGGIVGSWALVGVEDGRTRLTAVGSNDDLESLQGPVRDLGQEYTALYPPEKVRFSQNVNLSPNFPDAGLLLSDLWAAQGRPRPDGVVAVDPSGLAPLLAGAGDIAVPGGPSINAGNVVDVLLRQVYEDFAAHNAARKDYLSAVIGTAFSQALGGGAFKTATLRGVLDAARGGHIVAWSPRSDEQAALTAAGLSGALPEPSVDTAGVYLTNIAASKLDYWLTETVTTSGGCAARPATLQVELRNGAPREVPDYVANKGKGVARTTETVLLAVYLPPQRGVSGITVDGRAAPFSAGTERGWSLARLSVAVPRGATTTVDVALTGSAGPVSHLMTQPMVEPPVHRTGGCTS